MNEFRSWALETNPLLSPPNREDREEKEKKGGGVGERGWVDYLVLFDSKFLIFFVCLINQLNESISFFLVPDFLIFGWEC